MKIYWIPLFFFLLVNIAIDCFTFGRLKKSKHWPKWVSKAHVLLSALLYAALVFVVASGIDRASDNVVMLDMYLLWAFFGLNVAKWITLLVYSLSWLKILKNGVKRFVRAAAIATGVIFVFLEVWGTFFTPHDVEVKEVSMEFDNLPQEFDGYRILHFSDLHLGTYGTDTAFVSKCVTLMNAQHPDVMCFTGDLVNRHSGEAYPFVKTLSRLHAKDGILSIRGNHDENGYFSWPGATAQEEDFNNLIAIEESMGWKLLYKSHTVVKRDTARLVFIGVPCLTRNHHAKYGHVEEAYPNFHDGNFKILLQHNPCQWKELYRKVAHFDLMLAGHTHAFQVAFNFFGHSWSPAWLMCREWGGLYHERRNGMDEYLYTNTGLGEVGIPARMGATPEITVITLKKK